MREPNFTGELSESLRKSQRIALAPLVGGLAAGFGVTALIGMPSFWALLLIAVGASLTAALIWLQSRLIDMRFLPSIAQARALTIPVESAEFIENLPKGIVSMGTRQVVSNGVKGRIENHTWQAGFLECTDRDLQTGSTRSRFRGQLIQVENNIMAPDFILRPKRLKLQPHMRISSLQLPQVMDISTTGAEWSLHMKNPASASDMAMICRSFLEHLPTAPRPAQLIGLFCSKGWFQVLYANKQDLFSLWQGILPALRPEQAAQNVYDALSWSELAALAIIQTDHPILPIKPNER